MLQDSFLGQWNEIDINDMIRINYGHGNEAFGKVAEKVTTEWGRHIKLFLCNENGIDLCEEEYISGITESGIGAYRM